MHKLYTEFLSNSLTIYKAYDRVWCSHPIGSNLDSSALLYKWLLYYVINKK